MDERTRLRLKKYICIPLTKKRRHRRLTQTEFTLISNNCWGGSVYEAHDLQKQSPTVGLFIAPADYIEFLQHLEEYIAAPLEFIDPKESKWINDSAVTGGEVYGSYPVGRLKNIEIFFLHYHSEAEAREKWERRCKRIHWDKLLVKFNDQNGCTDEQLDAFEALPYEHKICFTVGDHQGKSIIHIKAPKEHTYIREPFGRRKEINVTEVLNRL